METHKRSMVKSITWRIIGVFLLGGIVWLALSRDPAWAGWAMVGVGAAWLLALLRR